MKKISNYKTLYISILIIMIIIIVIFCYIYDKRESEKVSIEHQDIGIENLEKITKEGQTEEKQSEQEHIIVHVAGEVNNPGVYQLNTKARVKDAINAADGITDNANMTNVNLAYVLTDGQKVYIPSSESDVDYNNTDIISGGKEKIKVNINTATQAELESLSGIGPSLASKIINYRAKNGKFKTCDDLKNVQGIGEAKYNALKDEICVSGDGGC